MLIRSFYLVSLASYFSLLNFSAYAATVTFEELALPGIGSQGQLAFQSRANDYLVSGGLIFTPTATSENIVVNGAVLAQT
ncbi:hypothetical protein ACH5Y9_04075 [Methylomonas sp. BW4-1]|uniref:hypothetical protein n=1 Tax=Methylomonas sp. BW4-1 TaxID=3376685 RepID=UPI004041C0B5